jgi:hypothetical protein
MMRLLLLVFCLLVCCRCAAALVNDTADNATAPAQGQSASWTRYPIWSLDPQALAAAGCDFSDTARVKLCETRKQASFYHTRGMSDAEEWCVEVYVTVPCWPPCFCNHTNTSVTTSNSLLGYAWAKKHLEDRSCTALPPCTQTVAKAAETPEAPPGLAASPRTCMPVLNPLVLLLVLSAVSLGQSIY